MKQDLVPAEKLAFICGGGGNLRSQYFYLKIKIKRQEYTFIQAAMNAGDHGIHKLSFLV